MFLTYFLARPVFNHHRYNYRIGVLYAIWSKSCMTSNFLQWGAIIIELIGLLLVAIELYFPKTSESLKALFEQTKPKLIRDSKAWVGSYIAIWVIATVAFSILDPSMNLITNVFFTAITFVVLLILAISKILVRLGVALGKGNSVGGVGLVLALIGFSINIIQW